jgi:hypothetical protein
VQPPEFVPERVAALDPLQADHTCARLPDLNARQDTGALAQALSGLLPPAADLAAFSYDECLAAMRDLGMVIASLKRHGAEPLHAVPGAEPVLLELGRRTGMVPRETIHHFAEMNPTGPRQRTYTDNPMEPHAIDIMRLSFRHFATAITLADDLAGTEPHDPAFATLLHDLAAELTSLDTAMNLSNEHLEPTWFYTRFLPYTASIVIGGKSYMGPAAAQFPLPVLDVLVWESDHASENLAGYRADRVQFTMPRWRARHAEWSRLPSLATRVNSALAAAPSRTVRESAAALNAALRALLVFRAKHLAYARKGSKPDNIALLQDIIDRTRHSMTDTRRAASWPLAERHS